LTVEAAAFGNQFHKALFDETAKDALEVIVTRG
jgi:hypothetical protein